MTGKSKRITVLGREMTFFNQRCRDWTHPYEWEGEGNLANSGCGIFSLCHAAQWLTGQAQDPEFWADFSCANGGRGDDGTDRPAMLHGLSVTREAAKLNFRYEEDGLRNDLDVLFEHLYQEKGVAFCNLRVGHIVALVAARIQDGEKQLLAIDSYSESASEKVRDSVREVIPGTEIVWPVKNKDGLQVGESTSYGAFWVAATQPRDFNLLHKI